MRSKSDVPSSLIAPTQPALATIGTALAKIEIRRGMIEVLVGIDQILDARATGELQRIFDFVDAPDVGIDEHRAAIGAFNYRKVRSAIRADDYVDRFARLVDDRFHWHRDI